MSMEKYIKNHLNEIEEIEQTIEELCDEKGDLMLEREYSNYFSTEDENRLNEVMVEIRNLKYKLDKIKN